MSKHDNKVITSYNNFSNILNTIENSLASSLEKFNHFAENSTMEVFRLMKSIRSSY
jgi:hypothetical protein